jgi:YfiH family protein
MTPRIEDDRLSALPGIRHGFFTRAGGVSTGIYASLNCGTGSDDDRALVLENRARAMAALQVAPDRLATPYQVHGTNVVTVDEPWKPGDGPKADGIVTTRAGIALGIGSADCGPLLFADAQARVIGAAHSGWRGALAGIGEATIAAMEQHGARRENIVAILGPTISQANYEVGPELHAQFTAVAPAYARFFAPAPRAGHFLFDLPGVIVARLAESGVQAGAVNLCTYADPDRFFSFRRTTHRGESDYGRMLAAITLA